MTVHRRARAARRIGSAALGVALIFGVAACTTDAAVQAKKAAGQDPAIAAADPMPSLAGRIDPYASLTMTNDRAAAPRASGETEVSRLPRIHLTIASPAVETRRVGETRKGYPAECKNPKSGTGLGLPLSADSVAAGSTAESCVQSLGNDPLSQELTYSLPDTKQRLWVYTRVTPILGGDNELKCAIIDPSTWKPAAKSEYGCDLRWMQQGEHLNPMPRVRLTAKPTVVVTDGAEGQRLLGKYCAQGQPECSYTAEREEIVPAPESRWKVANVYNNCGPDRHESAKHSYSESKSFGMSASVGTETVVDFGIKEIARIVVSLKYSHTWSTESALEFGVSVPVPWGWADIVYAQPTFLEIDGDFTVKADEANYIIRNTHFELPVKEGWKDVNGEAHSAATQHTRGVKIACPAEPFTGSTGTKMIDGSAAPAADTLKP